MELNYYVVEKIASQQQAQLEAAVRRSVMIQEGKANLRRMKPKRIFGLSLLNFLKF